MVETDIALPEEKEEENFEQFSEKRKGPSKEEEKVLKKQKEFEFGEAERIKDYQKQERKEDLKDKIIRWIIIGLAFVLVVVLFFWLL